MGEVLELALTHVFPHALCSPIKPLETPGFALSLPLLNMVRFRSGFNVQKSLTCSSSDVSTSRLGTKVRPGT
jgi:hypothetical protein